MAFLLRIIHITSYSAAQDIAGICLVMADKISTRLLSHVKFFSESLSTKPKHHILYQDRQASSIYSQLSHSRETEYFDLNLLVYT
jgi:hypothetical protein